MYTTHTHTHTWRPFLHTAAISNQKPLACFPHRKKATAVEREKKDFTQPVYQGRQPILRKRKGE